MIKLLMIICIAVALLIVFDSRNPMIQWSNCRGQFNPVKAFDRERNRLGQPDLLDCGPGGLAVWRSHTLAKIQIPLCNITLRDENVPHAFPSPHNDFLYGTYQLRVSDDKVLDIIQLTDSVFYDTLKCEITVRCQSLGAIFATLYLVTLIADGTVNLDVAKNMYTKAVTQTIEMSPIYNPKIEQSYIDHLRQKLKQLN